MMQSTSPGPSKSKLSKKSPQETQYGPKERALFLPGPPQGCRLRRFTPTIEFRTSTNPKKRSRWPRAPRAHQQLSSR
jgi:hypothetical protein